MPPWDQTECERFTATTENKSTECPASAIFIAAASPATPPPTIAILIPLAISFSVIKPRRHRGTEITRIRKTEKKIRLLVFHRCDFASRCRSNRYRIPLDHPPG